MTVGSDVQPVCKILEWDSRFFAQRIARYAKPRCVDADVEELGAECEARRIDCVYVLIDAGDTESLAAVQGRSYFADVRITFGTIVSAAAADQASAAGIRRAEERDIPALMRIARRSHRDTRFYADPRFAPVRCDQLYAVWIENSVRGFADAVFLVESEPGIPAGYVTCHRQAGAARGHIGLFAVDEASQGRGYGRALLDASLQWFAAAGVHEMTVSTQLRNLRAVRFYNGCGLAVEQVGMWFHFWRSDRIDR